MGAHDEPIESSADAEVAVKRYGSLWLAVLLLVAGLAWLVNRLAPAIDLTGLARDWWPAAMVLVGLAGAVHLRAPLGAAKGPVIFALLGLALLAVIHNPAPVQWRPALPPLILCAVGMAVLVARAVSASVGPPRPLERVLLIGLGRRLDWPVNAPSILDIRALVGGSIVTIPHGSTANAGRLEVTALLSEVEVVVPAGWAVFVHPGSGGERLLGVPAAPDAATADLELQTQSFLGRVVVRAA
jgi:hypothetical protein